MVTEPFPHLCGAHVLEASIPVPLKQMPACLAPHLRHAQVQANKIRHEIQDHPSFESGAIFRQGKAKKQSVIKNSELFAMGCLLRMIPPFSQRALKGLIFLLRRSWTVSAGRATSLLFTTPTMPPSRTVGLCTPVPCPHNPLLE